MYFCSNNSFCSWAKKKYSNKNTYFFRCKKIDLLTSRNRFLELQWVIRESEIEGESMEEINKLTQIFLASKHCPLQYKNVRRSQTSYWQKTNMKTFYHFNLYNHLCIVQLMKIQRAPEISPYANHFFLHLDIKQTYL